MGEIFYNNCSNLRQTSGQPRKSMQNGKAERAGLSDTDVRKSPERADSQMIQGKAKAVEVVAGVSAPCQMWQVADKTQVALGERVPKAARKGIPAN